MKVVRLIVLTPVVVYTLLLAIYLQLRLILGDTLPWLAIVNMFAPFLFAPLPIALLLSLILRNWVMVLWQSALLLIAVVWFGPLFLEKGSVQPLTQPIHVVTFNVYPRNRNLEPLTQWLQSQDADIVFLQDLGNQWQRGDLNILREKYPYVEISTAGETKLVLSRYPLRDAEGIDLNLDGRPDIQRMLAEVTGQMIALYNVHLENPSLRLSDISSSTFLDLFTEFDDASRNQQISRLLALLAAERHPHIVAGDFNMSSFSARYGDLSAVLGDAFYARGTGLGLTWSALGRIPLLFRLDYVWHSNHFRAISAEVGPALGSDHLPVTAKLELISLPMQR